jgi:transposase
MQEYRGVIDVALLSVSRRWHLRDKMSIREISRRTWLSRSTVRKYLASGVVEPRYPKRKSPSRLDDYELTLTRWLFRKSKRHRKQRRSVKQLHRDLVQLGYTGSYDRVSEGGHRSRCCGPRSRRERASVEFLCQG